MPRKRTKTIEPALSTTDPDMDGGAELSVDQRQAVEYLASGKTDAETADILGLNQNTISRWRHRNPAWAAAERAAEDEAVARTRRRLRALTARAVDTIAAVMDGKRVDPATGEESFNADPQHRLAAAKTVLDRAGVVEIKGLEVTGKEGGPVQIETREPVELTEAELRAELARLTPEAPKADS